MVSVVDVQSLRAEAATRALQRPRLPFAGTINDGSIVGVPVRRYTPTWLQRQATVYFAHGGYGLFGTLDLQDGYCRTLSQGLGCHVIAVDYCLTPEATFHDAVTDLVNVARNAAASAPLILAGDSAGGAIAVAAAAALPQTTVLLLTNPNLDLTLASFDTTAPDGPDLALSQYAFTAWAQPHPLSQAPHLHKPAPGLPDTFVAVGRRDALLPEARSFTARLHRQGRRATLLELPDTGHGFIGTPGTAHRVVHAMDEFLTPTNP